MGCGFLGLFCFFFFSSRRRHTRLQGDWSSDVCSSDLVEGTVRKVGDRLRITARLVDVHTGKVIWSDTYDRPAADPGQVESEVAGEVAAQVGAHLAIPGK